MYSSVWVIKRNIEIGWYLHLNESEISTISSTISSTELCWMLFVQHMMTAFWRWWGNSKLWHHHKILCTLSPPIPQFLGLNGWKYLFQILEQQDKSAIMESPINNVEWFPIAILLQYLLWGLSHLTLESLAKGEIYMAQ